MSRQEVLRQVEVAVMSDRNQDYAPPEQNFQRIADLWNVYLDGRSEVTPNDTSVMMVLVKVARAMASPHLIDHLVDIAGYAACAGDVMPDAPQQELPLDAAPVAVSPATDGGEYDDRVASYEGSPGFVRNDVWYGEAGRKIAIRDENLFVSKGVLVFG